MVGKRVEGKWGYTRDDDNDDDCDDDDAGNDLMKQLAVPDPL